MGFHSTKFVEIIWVGVILSAATTTIVFPIALPNCYDKCGNVKTPYPYGISESCYLNDTAKIGRLRLGVHKGRK